MAETKLASNPLLRINPPVIVPRLESLATGIRAKGEIRMRKLWVIAVAVFALAGLAVPVGQAAVVKASYTVPPDQPVMKKPPPRKYVTRAPVCANFFQCLFGGARRPDNGSNFR